MTTQGAAARPPARWSAGSVFTVAALVLMSALAWVATARSVAMGHMGSLLSYGEMHEGAMIAFDAVAFLAMWVVMIAAMMFPVVAPMVLAHRMVVRSRGEGPAPTIAFVAGYVAAWAALGLPALVAFVAAQRYGHAIGRDALGIIGGVVVIAAGVYQLTDWKHTCLKACRSPFEFLLTHNFSSGLPGALRAGASHGAFCVGCCWALMAVLAVAGMGNLLWMAALTVVFLLERNARFGHGLARLLAPILVIAGASLALSALL